MLKLTGGSIVDQDGGRIVAAIIIDRQDGSPVFTANNAEDGDGVWSIPTTEAQDFTLTIFAPSLRCQGLTFHLSKYLTPPPAPDPVLYDPTTGRLKVFLPFA